MLTLSQIVLVVVVTILCTLLVIFSIYIFKILDELKKTMVKTNSMMDDFKRITKSVADPIEHASEFVSGLKSGAKLVELAGEFVEKKKSAEPSGEKTKSKKSE
ncbi:hypothetical protein ACFL18_02275 [Patescibacteria group bacterium]